MSRITSPMRSAGPELIPSRFEALEPRLMLSASMPDGALKPFESALRPSIVLGPGEVRSSWPAPDTPKGPSAGFVGQRLTYSTKGTDPLGVHEYMFDWGDGSPLKWRSNTTQTHVYAAPGTYTIRAREKCPLDAFESDWSNGKQVTISEPAPNGAAPVLDNTGDMLLDPIDEDDRSNDGTTVADVIASAGGDRITDSDSGALEGIAVIAAGNTNGTWQYSLDGGNKWSTFKRPSDATAYLLQDTDMLRFVPNRNFNGTLADGITFRAWDQTIWSLTGIADATTNGGTTAFSTATETAGITVRPMNDAPVLNSGGDMRLYTVDKDAPTNPGTPVADIITNAGGDRITDVDAGDPEGIAVIAVNNTNGTWQYSTSGGTSWSDFGTPSDTSARLLRDTDLVRFVPNPDFNGLVAGGITFRAWDQTSGTPGGQADASRNGGTRAFSTKSDTVRAVVNPIAVTAALPFKSESLSVKLKGVGSCELHFAPNGVDLVKIVLRGTDWNSSLSISVKKSNVGGAGLITLQQIIFEAQGGQDSHLKSLKGKAVDLAITEPPAITPLPPDSVSVVRLHNYTYPARARQRR